MTKGDMADFLPVTRVGVDQFLLLDIQLPFLYIFNSSRSEFLSHHIKVYFSMPINKEKWISLPKDVQEAITSVSGRRRSEVLGA
jgi:hypothetical protein